MNETEIENWNILVKHIELQEAEIFGLQAKVEALIETIEELCVVNNQKSIYDKFDDRFFTTFQRNYLELSKDRVSEVLRDAYESIR